MENRPRSRKQNIVVQDVDGEILIYDLDQDKAFCLNQTAALVWQACDGTKTFSDISRRLGSEDIVWLALNDLKRKKLVEHTITTPDKFEGMSRREVLTRIGMGSILALPMIAALNAPVAAQAGSGSSSALCGQPCTKNSECELARPGMGGGMGTSECPFCVGTMGSQTCAAMLLAG